MKVEVLFFATLREVVGREADTIILPSDETTVRQFREYLMIRYPKLSDHLSASIAAVNEEFAFENDVIRDQDRVAFFPPVSGGHSFPTHINTTDKPICHDELLSSITTPETGAVCLFSGVVRGKTASVISNETIDTIETTFLEYEAYIPMAERKMNQVIAEIRKSWPKVQGIAIVQRVGQLSVGEPTVLIACASAHRNDGCFEAARYGIDRLKEIVPIWKKEHTPVTESWVEGNYQPQRSDRQNE